MHPKQLRGKDRLRMVCFRHKSIDLQRQRSALTETQTRGTDSLCTHGLRTHELSKSQIDLDEGAGKDHGKSHDCSLQQAALKSHVYPRSISIGGAYQPLIQLFLHFLLRSRAVGWSSLQLGASLSARHNGAPPLAYYRTLVVIKPAQLREATQCARHQRLLHLVQPWRCYLAYTTIRAPASQVKFSDALQQWWAQHRHERSQILANNAFETTHFVRSISDTIVSPSDAIG